jgi:hypothetical protein
MIRASLRRREYNSQDKGLLITTVTRTDVGLIPHNPRHQLLELGPGLKHLLLELSFLIGVIGAFG